MFRAALGDVEGLGFRAAVRIRTGFWGYRDYAGILILVGHTLYNQRTQTTLLLGVGGLGPECRGREFQEFRGPNKKTKEDPHDKST